MKLQAIAQALLNGLMTDEEAGQRVKALNFPTFDADKSRVWTASGDEDNDPVRLRDSEYAVIKDFLPTNHQWELSPDAQQKAWLALTD